MFTRNIYIVHIKLCKFTELSSEKFVYLLKNYMNSRTIIRRLINKSIKINYLFNFTKIEVDYLFGITACLGINTLWLVTLVKYALISYLVKRICFPMVCHYYFSFWYAIIIGLSTKYFNIRLVNWIIWIQDSSTRNFLLISFDRIFPWKREYEQI